ncbi:MAG: hypothetical protein ACI9CF_000418 [Candidatus Omnitrophota bacterium]|jgi:hypothetical protein
MKYQITAMTMFLFIGGAGLIWPLTHNRDQIESYEVPKDAVSMQDKMPPMHSDDDGHDHGPSMHWIKPEAWVQKEAGGMRLASFETKASKPIDISIVTLSGSAGGLEANINRWRGQLGLQPLKGGAQSDTIDKINVNGMAVVIVWLEGNADQIDSQLAQSILAAIIKHGNKQYFIKLMGPVEAIESERENLNQFLESISFE